MGCCSSSETDDESVADERYIKGPVIERRCTDLPCLLIFVVYFALALFVSVKAMMGGDRMDFKHGLNIEWDGTRTTAGGPDKYCRGDKKYTYYPDLLDPILDPILKGGVDAQSFVGRFFFGKGICVQECPSFGHVLKYNEGGREEMETRVLSDFVGVQPFNRCAPINDNIDPKVLEKVCMYPECDEKEFNFKRSMCVTGHGKYMEDERIRGSTTGWYMEVEEDTWSSFTRELDKDKLWAIAVAVIQLFRDVGLFTEVEYQEFVDMKDDYKDNGLAAIFTGALYGKSQPQDRTIPHLESVMTVLMEKMKDDKLWLEEKKKALSDKAEQVLEKIAKKGRDKNDPRCHVVVKVEEATARYALKDDAIGKMTRQLTQSVMQNFYALQEHYWDIVFLGVVGAAALSIIIIIMYSTCIEVSLTVLVVLVLVMMISIDYILLRKANWNRGKTGPRIVNFVMGIIRWFMELIGQAAGDAVPQALTGVKDKFDNEMMKEADDSQKVIYKTLAVIWTGLIIVAVTLLCFIKKQIRILIALISEAAGCLFKMPSLVLLPLSLVVTLLLCFWYSCITMFGLLTSDLAAHAKQTTWVPDSVTEYDIKKYGSLLILFSFFWLYFLHMAFMTSVISNCVVDWYFYRDDTNGKYNGIGSEGYFFGKPVLVAMGNVFRYNLGTLAMGSFILALITIPRMILEYMHQKIQNSDEANPVTAATVKALRCCMWCFHNCMKYVTEYAYINNAVTGKPFCRAAHASFVIAVKYPLQVGLNTVATGLLKFLSSFSVPCCLVVAAYWRIHDAKEKTNNDLLLQIDGFGICALVIAVLAYTVTAAIVGVYEVVLTTLFVCAMRDKENFGCMYAPESLQEVMGKGSSDDAPKLEAEMGDMSGGNKPTPLKSPNNGPHDAPPSSEPLAK